MAARLGVQPTRVIFTSGASEALGLAIHGTARQQRRPGHVLISAIEHPAVRETALQLARDGHEVEELAVTEGGRVDPATVAERLRPETFLFALMHVNNEVGITQPVGRIARLVKRERPRCRVLTDLVQSFGVLPTDLRDLGADMVAVSAHKLHGPKGVGALVLGEGVTVAPLWGGGDQEQGLRSGTENVPGVVGLGQAAELGKGDVEALRRQTALLLQAVQAAIPEARAMGDQRHRAPHILAVGLPGVRAEVAVNALAARGLYVSSGSACHSRRSLRSRVLQAMGVAESVGVLRFSVGRLTRDEEIAEAANILADVLPQL